MRTPVGQKRWKRWVVTKNQKEKGTSLPAVCCGFVGRFELVFFWQQFAQNLPRRKRLIAARGLWVSV